YTTNLAAYWNAAKASVADFKGGLADRIRPREHVDSPPAENDKGWVVQLSGYTYNRGGEPFVLEALVENIARVGAPTKVAPKTEGGSGGNTPAPATTGASAPAEGEAAPKTAKGPVIDLVSHVMLYKTDTKTSLIGQSIVSNLVTSDSGAGGSPPGGEGPP